MKSLFGRWSPRGAGAGPGYRVRERDLGKMHRAARAGDTARLQRVLLLGQARVDQRDGAGRTALHLACASGRSEVVTLLVERKCQLDLRDQENRTALIKAVQCQEEECATILLEHGADPNLQDVDGNTALHYAASAQNRSLATKLLSHDADIEAKNKDGFTPVLLAVSESKQQMADFLIKEASLRAVGNMQSNHQIISEHTLENRPRDPLQSNCPGLDENSEEESLSRLSSKPGIDDSWPTSDDDFDFEAKTVPRPNLTKLMAASVLSKRKESKCGIMRPENRALFEDNLSDTENENVLEPPPKPSVGVQDCSQRVLPSSETVPNPPTPLATLGPMKERAGGPAADQEENVIGTVEEAAQELTDKGSVPYARGAHRSSRRDMLSALGLGEDDDADSPWDSESVSESPPQKYVDRLSGTGDPRANSGQVEDMFYIPSCMSGSSNFKTAQVESTRNVGIPGAPLGSVREDRLLQPPAEGEASMPDGTEGRRDVQTPRPDLYLSPEVNLDATSDEDQERLRGRENNHPQAEEEMQTLRSSEVKVSENAPEAASAGFLQHRRVGEPGSRPLPVLEKEDSESISSLPGKEGEEEGTEKPWVPKASASTLVPEKPKSRVGPRELREGGDDASSLSDMDWDDGRSVEKEYYEKNKVRLHVSAGGVLGDLTQSSETSSEDCEAPYANYNNTLLLIEQLGKDCRDSVSLLKIQDAVLSYERLIELKRNHCELLAAKNKKLKSKTSRLQKELSEARDAESRLQRQTVEREQELCSLRFALKQEEEKRQSAELLQGKIREQLSRADEQGGREAEARQQLELSVRTLDLELRTLRSTLSQAVEERDEIQRQLSREQSARVLQEGILASHLSKQKELRMACEGPSSEVPDRRERGQAAPDEHRALQDEVAMLKLEVDTMRNQNQEKEKKYLEDIAVVRERNEDLQRAAKRAEDALAEAVFQHGGQVSVLTAENAALKSQLDSAKQSRDRLESEAETFRSRLATATQDHQQSQASRRELELTFRRAQEEWTRLREKLDSDVANLKEGNEVLSQQLSRTESKLNALEIELHRARDALREKTLTLECAQRDLSLTRGQKQEVERMYQSEHGRVSQYIGKQESLEERLSQLQSENLLLRQQLDAAHSRSESKEKTVLSIHSQFRDTVRRLQAESEKQGLALEERNKELTSNCEHLRETVRQREGEKAEREVLVRQLQQELADTLKKQSMSEASLEVVSRCRASLEEEKKDLQKQLQEVRDQHAEAVRCVEKTQDHVQKLEVENGRLNITVQKQACRMEQLQKNLLSTSSIDDLTAKLEAASSKCRHLEAQNRALQQDLVSMKATQKKCEKLKKNKKQLEQEVVTLKSHLELNVVELGQVEQYKQELEERARQEVVEKLTEVNLFLQAQAASQEALEQLRENNHASVRARLEVRIQELELELAGMRTSREDSSRAELEKYKHRIQALESDLARVRSQQAESNKLELERYKQLFLEEFKVRQSLSDKLKSLRSSNERLVELLSSQLLAGRQQSVSFLSALSARPLLEPSCAGNPAASVLQRNLTARESVLIPPSNPRPAHGSMEAYLAKMQQELEKSITRELEEAAAEFEPGPYTFSPPGSNNGSNLTQDLLLKASQEYVEILKQNYLI